MPWCPKCKTEYREGYDTCSDCEAKLVDVLDVEQDLYSIGEIKDWALLIQTFNENEAEIVESLLRPYDIPTLRKDRGAGGYVKIYMGMTNLGIDLYVPANRYWEAKDLINVTPKKQEKPDPREITYSNTYQNERRKRVWLLFFIIPLVIPLILHLLLRVAQYFYR